MKKTSRDISIGAQMAIAVQLMKRTNHKAIIKSGYDITMEQLAVLEVLHNHGKMNMTELSKAVWKQNANITRIVDKLEKKELVSRIPVKEDRRAYILNISEKGTHIYNNVMPTVFDVYNKITSNISEEEKSITLKTIKKIISNISSQ